MKLRVLGSDSSGNCYLLQNEEETLIIECGIRYKDILKALDFDLSTVVGCLVSHEHLDHSKAVKDITKAGIDVYSSIGTLAKSEAMNYRGKVIKSEEQFKIGGFTILPFQVEHDAPEPLGFLISHKDTGKLLFATDTYYVQYKFKGLNHILIECNYSEGILNYNFEQGYLHPGLRNRLVKSHFSLENVKDFLKANDLSSIKSIMLIHLSDGNSNAAEFKNDIERLTGKPVYIADKGLEIDLGGF